MTLTLGGTMELDGQSAPRSRRRSHKLVLALSMVVLLMFAACIFLFTLYQQAVKDQAKATVPPTSELTNLLSKSIDLPDEPVSIATVMDKTKLSEPQLAAEAENGDQLLVYSASRRVILYRPSTKKVIDMFHITADPGQPAATTAPKR